MHAPDAPQQTVPASHVGDRAKPARPMVADFGERSEVAKYAGRRVGKAWRCAFSLGFIPWPT